MRIITYLLCIIAIIIGISFACLNAEVVKVNFYVNSFSLPLSLWLVSTFGLGLVCGAILIFLPHFRLKRQIFWLNQRIKLAEKEVKNLRAVPWKDAH